MKVVIAKSDPLRWWRQICIAQHSIKCAPIVLQSGPALITLHWANEFDCGRKGGKSPPTPFPHPKKKTQKSISSIGSCPMTACLAFYWCCSHRHTHSYKPPWHLFSSLLLALHCTCHMASEKAAVCVCACATNACGTMCRRWGQRGVIEGWPADKGSSLHQGALWIHGDKPCWIGEQKPWRSRLRSEGGRRGSVFGWWGH